MSILAVLYSLCCRAVFYSGCRIIGTDSIWLQFQSASATKPQHWQDMVPDMIAIAVHYFEYFIDLKTTHECGSICGNASRMFLD